MEEQQRQDYCCDQQHAIESKSQVRRGQEEDDVSADQKDLGGNHVHIDGADVVSMLTKKNVSTMSAYGFHVEQTLKLGLDPASRTLKPQTSGDNL